MILPPLFNASNVAALMPNSAPPGTADLRNYLTPDISPGLFPQQLDCRATTYSTTVLIPQAIDFK